MLKEYRKTATIKAERFGGGHEQVKKYGIQDKATLGEEYSGNRWTILTKEGPMIVNVGDWIATGVEGEHWAIADDIFRKTYEEVKNDKEYLPHTDISLKMNIDGVYTDNTHHEIGEAQY